MRFAKKSSTTRITTNHEGSKAWKKTDSEALYSFACTSCLCPKFYEDGDQLETLRRLIRKVDPVFANRLVKYVRHEMHLRSVPIAICVELARIGKLDQQTVVDAIDRPDEIVELLSYYQQANQRTGTKKLNKLSKAIYSGIKYIFESGKFDEYQFAKYNQKTEIRFRDALFLTHPKPSTEKLEKLFKDIACDTLEVPYTWETELSRSGNTKEVWESLIDSKRVGYMALLRNLRNILKAEVSSKHLNLVTSYLSDKEAVISSRQFPFRFLSAYKELKEDDSIMTSSVLDALEEAACLSAANIKGFSPDSEVLIACDVSGSMMQPISPKSKVENFDIGLVLGALAKSYCKNAYIGMFGDTWKTFNVSSRTPLATAYEFRKREGEVGYSTNGHLVLQWAVKKKIVVDKVFMFTDNQMWDSTKSYRLVRNSPLPAYWSQYKQISPKAKLFLFDLAGYSSTPISTVGNDVYLIAGWSDKVFDIVEALEKGSSIVDIIMGADEREIRNNATNKH